MTEPNDAESFVYGATGPAGPVQTQLERLAAEFPAEAYQSRRGAAGGPELTYISIDQTIKRLNDVLGPGWDTRAISTITPEAGRNGGTTYLAVCELHMDANVDGTTKTAYGVGAMKNPDPDMALKSALAEAIKKAGHQLGIGLHLWDKDTRERIERKMDLAKASDAKLKAAVYQIARDRLDKTKPTAAEVAKLFGKTTQEMVEPDVNREILKAEGLL